MSKCRRCSECPDSKHHWLDNPHFGDAVETLDDDTSPSALMHTHVCKHCDVLGDECVDCDGDGCCSCDGEGVVEVKVTYPTTEGTIPRSRHCPHVVTRTRVGVTPDGWPVYRCEQCGTRYRPCASCRGEGVASVWLAGESGTAGEPPDCPQCVGRGIVECPRT